MSHPLSSWNSYPMGPALRQFLGLEVAATGMTPTALHKMDFSEALLAYLENTPQQGEEEVLQELVQMDLPHVAYLLSDTHPRFILYRGLSAMMLGLWEEAEAAFCQAQAQAPLEPAPYSNLLLLWTHEGRWDEMAPWIDVALAACPNHAPIWESVVAYCLQEEGYDRLRTYVTQAHSWMGTCILNQLDPELTAEDREKNLARFFHEGERDPAFLIEYTALLGENEKYQEIPAIIWQARRLAKDPLPWQLGFHMTQAFAAVGNAASYEASRQTLLRAPGTPASLKDHLPEDLYAS